MGIPGQVAIELGQGVREPLPQWVDEGGDLHGLREHADNRPSAVPPAANRRAYPDSDCERHTRLRPRPLYISARARAAGGHRVHSTAG